MQICKKNLINMQAGLVLLAAGASSRMGFVKQNLMLGRKTMIQHLVHEALMSEYQPITVVLGAHKNEIVPNLKDLPITLIDNPLAESGMGSSIRMGLIGTYMTHKSIEAVCMLTTDMPLITSHYLDSLLDLLRNNDKIDIVASKYKDGFGVPAIFRRTIFEELLDIKGDQGAKTIIEKHQEKTLFVELAQNSVDLDTPEDINAFKKMRPDLFEN
jgi:molybdenum cofactor cytidylyltransferase